jgi:2'-hydroxyisoflavone reductase
LDLLAPGQARVPLNMLVIGGTKFIGPHLVNYALARGHKLTLLNRNQSRPDMFKGKVEQIIGDLNTDVSGLKGKSFDTVMDIPTQIPLWVKNTSQYLAGNVKHYVFVSTLSVYRDTSKAGIDESGETTPMPERVTDPYALQNGASYAANKSFLEKDVQKAYPGANLIVRPGFIVGPLDPTDRFTYWPVRVRRGGEMILPGKASDPMQFCDVRDLAEWFVRMAENKETGIYNCDGPTKEPMPIGEMVNVMKSALKSDAKFVEIPAAFLREQQARSFPMWTSPEGSYVGYSQMRHDKALAKGLTYRPLETTIRDTLAWHDSRPEADRKPLEEGTRRGIGLTPAREAEVIAAWRARQGGY